MFKALWDIMNGKKFDAGTIVVVAAFLIQQYLGVNHDQAISIVSSIMAGVGGVTMLIGLIHRWVKAGKISKPISGATTTIVSPNGTPDSPTAQS